MARKVGYVFFALMSMSALAVEEGAAKVEEPGFLMNLITVLLPVLVVVGILSFSMRGMKKKNNLAIDRSIGHMERSEKQAERIIELLEQLNQKLDKGSLEEPPPIPTGSSEA
jgi:hypothetical protein